MLIKYFSDITIAFREEALSDGTKIYSALCLELGVASQGETIEEATENVREAVSLWFEAASESEIARQDYAASRSGFSRAE